jgi:hypothetical protein
VVVNDKVGGGEVEGSVALQQNLADNREEKRSEKTIATAPSGPYHYLKRVRCLKNGHQFAKSGEFDVWEQKKVAVTCNSGEWL